MLDRNAAIAEAAACTAEAARRQFRGELHGIPVGIKDIIAVAGRPNECGSSLLKGDIPTEDATLVTRLKQAGAIILGKTVTTEFAYFTPTAQPPTANPWNRLHTPGGSSSGSAAAVAAGHVPLAFGTQTVGSILRPASYCGVVGWKPAHGWMDCTGVHPFARSFDTLGSFTGSVDSAAYAHGVLTGDLRPLPRSDPPRLAWLQEFFLSTAAPEMQSALTMAVVQLMQQGAGVIQAPLPASFATVAADHRAIMAAEAAVVHMENFSRHPDAFSEPLATLLEEGMHLTPRGLSAALERREQFRRDMLAGPAADGRLLLTPAAKTAAPAGLTATGDPAFNGPWTYLGWPAITLPMARSANGLPLGLQLAAPPGQETRLLTAARWCESTLACESIYPDPI